MTDKQTNTSQATEDPCPGCGDTWDGKGDCCESCDAKRQQAAFEDGHYE